MSKLFRFVIMMLLIIVYTWTLQRNLELPANRYKNEVYDMMVTLTTLGTFMYLLYIL